MPPLNLQPYAKTSNRPYVTTVLAMSADGKISNPQRGAARFPSAADQHHLEKRLAIADATLFGAGTLRAYGTTALIKDAKLLEKRRQNTQHPQPIHIVCSRSGQLDPTAKFFTQPIPRWLLTTSHGAANWQDTDHFERLWIAPTVPTGQDFAWEQILTKLKALNIHQLIIMGGGQLVAALMAADLIDELWLTICPLIIGGDKSPTPCDGDGFSLDNAPRFTLISHQTVGNEVFLNYKRHR
ncbi:RibD family protein [Adonisia turfae]|uniref:RibD family protein n=1 Tax=Adonisia turfae CCMR0081 TaxID=2292702 RepID=A0A6M0RS19_9CYAN|nr:RibD family protein [Adonisia turfae]NEZ58511.1 RibD family protein [Adonisia turfae CCMR0081]